MEKHTQKMVQQALGAVEYIAEKELEAGVKYLVGKLNEKIEKKLKVVK